MASRRVRNESRLRRKLRRFPEALRQDIGLVMQLGGEEIRAEIERTAPRAEGRLAEAAHKVVSRDGLSVKIGYGNQVGFRRLWNKGGLEALWQEFGTRHHAAQPFIRPAFRAKLGDFLSRVDRAVNRTLRRASSGDF